MSEQEQRRAAISVDDVYLDVIVPGDSENLDFEHALSSLDDVEDGAAGLLQSVAQRKLLFYDEHLLVYVVLRLPYVEEDVLKSFLNRVTLTVEVQIVQVQPAQPPRPVLDRDGRPKDPLPRLKEVIFHTDINGSEEPIVIVRGNDDDEDEKHTHLIYALWKVDTLLSRPRTRIQPPAVVFRVYGTCGPGPVSRGEAGQGEYMQPLVPASVNILGALKNDPAFKGTEPRLSALRVSRVLPASPTIRESSRHIRPCPPREIKIVPAVSARVRYSRINTYAARPTTVASMDFEVLPFGRCSVTLESIEIQFPSGVITDLTDTPDLKPPLLCQTRDETTFLYRLVPSPVANSKIIPANATTSPSLLSTLSLTLTCTAHLTPSCHPKLTLHWLSPVDFSTQLNPNFPLSTQPLQRPHRPASLPVSAAPPMDGTANTSFDSTHFIPGSTRASASFTPGATGSFSPYLSTALTITFASRATVSVAQPFQWTVTITNRSSESQKIALLPIAHRKKGSIKVKSFHRPKQQSTGSNKSDGGKKEIIDLAEPVVDENIVFAVQRNSVAEPADLVCLTPEVKVGPLYPSSCHVTALTFLPLSKGPLRIDAVRVVDLNTGESVDVRDVPDVLVVGEEEDGKKGEVSVSGSYGRDRRDYFQSM
ncbi:MAG: hypothetical protein M1834_001949 [Cirrosporium novae-zelandiae]|nr:MAG: hypothetical protein M1834_001949 [Cirrosporium novae-zelandiae]